jgi:HEPN domain-containing protein
MDKKTVLEWFKYADKDVFAVNHLLTAYPQPYEIICYHCQQAAEKYLKGFLVYNDIKPPKIHELDTLCEMCSKLEEKFDDIIKECLTLTVYGVQARYPYEIEIDEYQMKKAVEAMNKIKNFALIKEVLETVSK